MNSIRTFAQETGSEALNRIIENSESNAENPSLQLDELTQLEFEKINLNNADEEEFQKLLFLNELEIKSVLNYRKIVGSFIDVYELQSVPELNIEKAKQLRLYVKINNGEDISSIKKRFLNGEHHVLWSSTIPAQIAEGFKKSTNENVNHFEGSSLSILLKYNYNYNNKLNYGFLAEKDAGESFFKKSNSAGFDFYSSHLFLRDFKIFKSIAIGDFNVNIGQGLLIWQSFAFAKGSDVLQIKRQGEVLKHYRSSNENNFMRGLGATIKHKRTEFTFFASSFKKDANGIEDTLNGFANYFSSYQNSGLHRTQSEIADKKLLRQNTFGARISLKHEKFSIALNAVHYQLSLKKQKDDLVYHLYDLIDNKLTGISFDYSTTLSNIHFFGEFAMSEYNAPASVNGALISVSKNVDVSLLYRYLSPRYQSFYSNVFCESYNANNESGFYSGLVFRPWLGWQFSYYADYFKFPWLKYSVNAPSDGVEYNLSALYTINKKTELGLVFRSKTKLQNESSDENIQIKSLIPQQRNDIRFQVNLSLNDKLTMSNRLEISNFKINNKVSSNGFLFYTDWKCNHIIKNCGFEFRLLLFDVNSYDSRIYAYENDLAQSFSIPNYSGNGFKYFLTLKLPVFKKLTFYGKWLSITYFDTDHIGDSLNKIEGNKKSECKLQLFYCF